MATATQKEPRREYRCECGHAMGVSGGGRHRVYFEFADVRLTDPVMDRKCALCGRGLPGKNQSSQVRAAPTVTLPSEQERS